MNGLISKLPALISERADKGNKKTKTAIIIAVRYIDFIVGPPLYCRVLLLTLRFLEKRRGGYLFALRMRYYSKAKRRQPDSLNYGKWSVFPFCLLS